MIRFLCSLKVNSIVAQVLIDMDKIHEEFITIFKERDRYEKMK